MEKILKRLGLYENIVVVLMIFFVIYNTFFGWNLEAQSLAEKICDHIFTGLMAFTLTMLFHNVVLGVKLLLLTFILFKKSLSEQNNKLEELLEENEK